jgi:hypothetical protein
LVDVPRVLGQVKAVLVVCPGGEESVRAALPGGRHLLPELVPDGFDPRAGLLAVLGQDPRGTWTGPASWGIAAARAAQAEDETAYLFTPVRAVDGRIVESRPMSPGRARDLFEWLREEAGGEMVQTVPGDPPVLLVAEPLVGPPALCPATLAGRSLDTLPAGPPALLARMIETSRRACAEFGGPVTHLFPNSPGGPSGVRPLRETWLGLGPSVVVGDGPLAVALSELLRLSRVSAETPQVAVERYGPRYDLVVVVMDTPPDSALELGCPTVVVSDTDFLGRVPVAVSDGVALGEGVDLLKPLLIDR